MHRGYVKLWRKSLDSPIWKNPDLWRFWSWCLLKAAHGEFAELVGYQCVPLKPGQFVFGRKVAARETGLSERTIRTCLDVLQKLENVTITSTNKFSVLTIVKWEDYQAGNQQTTNKATSKRPANDHIQELQEEKNKNTPLNPPNGELGEGEGSAFASPAKKGRSTPRYTEAFEHFWTLYPRRTAKAKAFESWKALDIECQREAYRAIKRQVEASHFRNSQGVDMIPHASTWLNQCRWEDEIRPRPQEDPNAHLTPKMRAREESAASLRDYMAEKIRRTEQELMRQEAERIRREQALKELTR